MSAPSQAQAAQAPRRAAMGTFERHLTVWVALCIVASIALGAALPGVFHVLGDMKAAEVNIPVAVLIVSSRPGGALIHEGHGFRAGQVAGLQAPQLEACLTDHALYPPVHMTASGDVLPRRSERVLPTRLQ
jgi:hypothetical protein